MKHIPVNDALLFMEVLEGLGHLDNDMSRKLFAKICETNNLVEQLTTRGELENNVVIRLGFRKVDELDDVGMIELAHNLHLFQNVCAL